ncbi:MAG: dihydroorotase [candidate division WOR-3 bacterium]
MKYLVKNCLLEGGEKVDILVEGGKIVSLSTKSLKVDDALVIDAEGLWAIPGLVDMHTHARVPGQEHKETLESLSKAALRGGYTHLLIMPNTEPPIDSPEVFEYVKMLTKGLPVNVFISATITKGRMGKELVEMGMLKEGGAKAFTDDGNWVEDDFVMLNACTYASNFDVMVISHSEKPQLSKGFANYDEKTLKYGMKFRLPISEELAVYRDCRLAEISGCHLHVAHISYYGSVEVIKMFKERGANITCEVTPHHLIFSTDNIEPYNPNFICNPPIRDEENRRKLVRALKEGFIDIVATDHAPHAYYEKEITVDETLPGIEGLETSFSALYTHLVLPGDMDIKTLIDVMSHKPAKLLGIDNSIREGNEANFFLFNPNIKWVVKGSDILSKGKNNPFIGKELRGRVVSVFCKGKYIKEV